MKETTPQSKIARAFLWLAGGIAAVEIAARLNVRREQTRRRGLGGRLFTRVLGAGDPVVFIPGYQGSTEFWQHAFDSLSSRHRLIFVDALGFGRSPWPDRPPTLDDHLEALRGTLVAEGGTRRVTLVAHSFGTVLAAYYAERYPDEVDRLLLFGTPVFADEADARRRLREISPIAALFSLNRFLAREACMLMCALRPLLEVVLPRLKSGLPPGVVHDCRYGPGRPMRSRAHNSGKGRLRHGPERPVRSGCGAQGAKRRRLRHGPERALPLRFIG